MFRASNSPPSSSSSRLQKIAAGFCFLFGIAFILNVHPIGDGLWYWYATSLRSGHLLYADMHLPLQPLFVLLTVWMQKLFGLSWLASKLLAVVQLIIFCLNLLLILKSAAWKDWQRAIVLLAVFGLTISAFYYRFDDYHITGHIFVLLSIYLLLLLVEEQRISHILQYAICLGALSGFSIVNRLNDGAALFTGVAILLPLFASRKRLAALLIFFATAGFAVAGIVALTGDSAHSWVMETIIRAAAIKGGTGHVMAAPLTLPLNTGRVVRHTSGLIPYQLYALAASIILGLLLPQLRYAGKLARIMTIVASAITLLCVPFLIPRPFISEFPLRGIENVLLILAYPLIAFVLYRFLRTIFSTAPKDWERRELLLILPFGQLLAGAMTSGQSFLEAFPPVAMLLLLLPIASPLPLRKGWLKSLYLGMLGYIALMAFVQKIAQPYYWHHFSDETMFVGRQWYRHPDFGPMYIANDQLNLMATMCATIHQSGDRTQLLALPFPYPNYFCNIAPWRGYVQTWYDTTSQGRIDGLIADLNSHPPEWIVYQRALDTLHYNEEAFTHGKPLPHRALDALIMERIRDHRWTVASDQCFRKADWILIATHPAHAAPPKLCVPDVDYKADPSLLQP